MKSRIAWHEDQLIVGGVEFNTLPDEGWHVTNERPIVFKRRSHIEQYDDFWRSRRDFTPRYMLELGILFGGSLPFWFEFFRPEKLVAIDIGDSGDNPNLRDYVTARNLEKRIRTFWGVDQSDQVRLRQIVGQEFGGQVHLVIDDASHYYAPTRASFETLFPLLSPGGLYIIEDWKWDQVPAMRAQGGEWTTDPGLTKLITEIVAGTTGADLGIGTITIKPDFVVIERARES